MNPRPPESCIACEQGRNCPRRIAMQLHRLNLDALELARGTLHTDNGGMRVSGDDSVRLPSPKESATARTDRLGRWTAIAAGLLALAAVLYEARPL